MVGTITDEGYLGRVLPPAEEHHRFAWDRGAFDTARRSYTAFVEGSLRAPGHLVMATLKGGAARHEFVTDRGYRHDGPDRPGIVSFLPAYCERRLKLQGVAWQWASITLAGGQKGHWDGIGQAVGVSSVVSRPIDVRLTIDRLPTSQCPPSPRRPAWLTGRWPKPV